MKETPINQIWNLETYENPDDAVDYEFHDWMVIRGWMLLTSEAQARHLIETLIADEEQ